MGKPEARLDAERVKTLLGWLAWAEKRCVDIAAREAADAAGLPSENVAPPSLRHRLAGAIARMDVLAGQRAAAAVRRKSHEAQGGRAKRAAEQLRIAADTVRSMDQPVCDAGGFPRHADAAIQRLRRISRDGGQGQETVDLSLELGLHVQAWADRCIAMHRASEEGLERTRPLLAEQELLREEIGRAEDRQEKTVREGAFGEYDVRRSLLMGSGIPGAGRLPLDVLHVERAATAWEAFDAEREAQAQAEIGVHADGFLAWLREISGGQGKGHLMPDPWPLRSGRTLRLACSAELANGLRKTERMFVDSRTATVRIPRPVDDLSQHRMARCLPLIETLAGRQILRAMPYTPIPANAVSLNLREIFRPVYWAALSKNISVMRGHVCCVCGAVIGHTSAADWPERSGSRAWGLEVHEAWDWEVVDREERIGVQRLVSLLPVCVDCHNVFHADQVADKALRYAETHRLDPERAIEEAWGFVEARRAAMLSGIEEFPHLAARALMEAEAARSLRLAASVDHWVLDLSALRTVALAGAIPIMVEAPKRSISPAAIAGIDVVDASRGLHQAVSVDDAVAAVKAMAAGQDIARDVMPYPEGETAAPAMR